jgi:hypothetical protein
MRLDTFRRASYDCPTVAVTVRQEPLFVVLDEADRIVGVGPHAESQFGPLLGTCMWDCFPGSEPLFKPYYDSARRSGEPVEFVQFYDGNVARVRAVPAGEGRLALEWEQLARLDTRTLDSLSETLNDALERLSGDASARRRQTIGRAALHFIEGGE